MRFRHWILAAAISAALPGARAGSAEPQTPVYKDEAALLQQLGATKMMAKNPEWPVLGPPQGIWDDIWPLGETAVHDPVYKPVLAQTP